MLIPLLAGAFSIVMLGAPESGEPCRQQVSQHPLELHMESERLHHPIEAAQGHSEPFVAAWRHPIDAGHASASHEGRFDHAEPAVAHAEGGDDHGARHGPASFGMDDHSGSQAHVEPHFDALHAD